jgi:hypothetical protein
MSWSLWDPKNSRTTSLFKAVNPELYVKPNIRIGIVGTSLFVGILSYLLWEKRRVDLERKNTISLLSTKNTKGSEEHLK